MWNPLKLIFFGILAIASVPMASDALAAGWAYTVVTPVVAPENPSFDLPVINDHGVVAFDGADYNCGGCYAVYKWHPGGQPQTLTSSVDATFQSVTITNNGNIGFEALTTKANSSWSDTIMVANGTKVTQIAPTKHGASDTPPFYYEDPSLLNDGSAVFYINGGNNGRRDLQRAKAGQLQTIRTPEYVCTGTLASPAGSSRLLPSSNRALVKRILSTYWRRTLSPGRPRSA